MFVEHNADVPAGLISQGEMFIIVTNSNIQSEACAEQGMGYAYLAGVGEHASLHLGGGIG